MKSLIIVLLCTALSGCKKHQSEPQLWMGHKDVDGKRRYTEAESQAYWIKLEQIREEAHARGLDLTDGVSQAEAFRIAEDHIKRTGEACYSIQIPEERSGSWWVSIAVGIAGLPFHELEIRRSDGFVAVREQHQ
jgi:hypothetical protein